MTFTGTRSYQCVLLKVAPFHDALINGRDRVMKSSFESNGLNLMEKLNLLTSLISEYIYFGVVVITKMNKRQRKRFLLYRRCSIDT